MWNEIFNHLWQSTLFAAALALLSIAFRKNHARTRYALWLAASLKFLVPFSLLISLGQQFAPKSAPRVIEQRTLMVIEQTQRTSPLPILDFGSSPDARRIIPLALFAIWLCGVSAVAFRAWSGWRRIRAAMRTAIPLPLEAPIPVCSTASTIEPGVFGIRRPVLLLPEGIHNRLTPEQFDAIVAHELCHVRRRDNLTSAIHMTVEAIFWFHPLVWWLGGRLVEERERACDEEVVRLGNPPHIYAEGILTVCKFYLESPLVCVSGVTGSNLRRRIESIMAHRGTQGLTIAKKLLLAAAGVAAVAVPIAAGVLNPRPIQRASTQQGSAVKQQVRISILPDGRFVASGATARLLIQNAYQLREFQILGGPDWIH
ncbi:MAG TPA: M56 family metallopeptidase, partial [Bryobacteraceae bacterium]|nr:M56 family metallopeptidase [Bryobacteraceae bacterium]